MNTLALKLKRTLVLLEVKETALVLSMSVALPYLVHLAPPLAGRPLGAVLLPMFYAPFIAIMLFRPHVAIVTSLLSPLLNSLLTGHPQPERLGLLTFELVIFSIITYLIQRRRRNFWGTAALAYLAAVLSGTFVLGKMGLLWSIIGTSLPGAAVLVLINLLLLRFQPKDNDV